MVDKWLSSIDKGEVVGAIFYDLKKAFDIVNHEILIRKTRYVNLIWLYGYTELDEFVFVWQETMYYK